MSAYRALFWLVFLAVVLAFAACDATGPEPLTVTVSSEVLYVSHDAYDGPSRSECLYWLRMRVDGPAGRWVQADHTQVVAGAPASFTAAWEVPGDVYFPATGRIFAGESRRALRVARVFPASHDMSVRYTWWLVDDRGAGKKAEHTVDCGDDQ